MLPCVICTCTLIWDKRTAGKDDGPRLIIEGTQGPTNNKKCAFIHIVAHT